MKLVFTFVVGSLLFTAIERIWPANPAQRWLRRGFFTDVLYWFFTPVVSGGLTGIAAAVVVVILARHAGVTLHGKAEIVGWLRGRHTWVTNQPVWRQIVEIVVLNDFLGYWQHRLFHRGRLWSFHAIHHASQELDWLSSVRLHPVNEILGRLFTAIPLVLLGFNPFVVAALTPLFQTWAIAIHANVSWTLGPFRYLLAGPAFHRWHHTSEAEGLDKNFSGLLPIWDLIFGTFYMPAGKLPQHFGVLGESVPEGLLAQLAYPFRAAPRGAPSAAGTPALH